MKRRNLSYGRTLSHEMFGIFSTSFITSSNGRLVPFFMYASRVKPFPGEVSLEVVVLSCRALAATNPYVKVRGISNTSHHVTKWHKTSVQQVRSSARRWILTDFFMSPLLFSSLPGSRPGMA